MKKTAFSWARYPLSSATTVQQFISTDQLPQGQEGTLLPYGSGLSYGDVCQNDGGVLVQTGCMRRFLQWDPKTGVLRCESGVRLVDILNFTIPQGWILPVIPGTSQVTVGGAIANDVHGKNQATCGTFARTVLQLELLRSSGERLQLSSQQVQPLFFATLGGLGMTGLITWADLQLRRVPSPWLQTSHERYDTASDLFQALQQSIGKHEYAVAWIDCLNEAHFGRGILSVANHAESANSSVPRVSSVTLPVSPPCNVLSPMLMRLFNAQKYWRGGHSQQLEPYHSYYFPLDAITNWNVLYGPKGFLQYQCVIPANAAERFMQLLRQAPVRPYLTVLKVYAEAPSPALLSFPQPGLCFACDFPYSAAAKQLFSSLDEFVVDCGGRVYLAKDACVSATIAKRMYPTWEALAAHRDPQFSSNLWRRLFA